MDSKELKNKSRYLSLLLRHKPEKENLFLDEKGYVQVSELLSKLNLSMNELEWIVDNNDKKRFSFNENKTKLKANQGHSINIQLELKKIVPPNILFHGTTISNQNFIMKSGLKKMSRHHVHLTDNQATAHDVGIRYAKYNNKVWIVVVDAMKMYNDGYEFFKTENNVYLTDHVPCNYIIKDYENKKKI